MKIILSSLLVLLFTLSVYAQCSYYKTYLQRGDSILKTNTKEKFNAAMNAYNIALVHCPEQAKEIQERIIIVFQQIEKLKEEAEREKEKAQKNLIALRQEQKKTQELLKETLTAKQTADSALQQANKLIGAFYFHDGKFALARKSHQYFYFIDKNGDEIEKLGRWDNAELFDWRGFAKVREKANGTLTYYLLDTLGNRYPVAYDIQDLSPSITALDLSGKRLDSIPRKVYDQLNLQVLLLNHNSINEVHESIGNLTQLQVLNLGQTHIQELPITIGNLIQLRNLDLRESKLKELPNLVGKLIQLSTLSLKGTLIKNLPREVWNLTRLQVLDLSNSKIESLPMEIGNLTQLQHLYLYGTQLKELPNSLWSLTGLSTLHLSGTRLVELPKGIGNLTHLKTLDLGGIQIKELPNEIGNLAELQDLDLGGLPIKLLPNQIGNFLQLRTLDLVFLKIETLPNTIGNLTKLRALNLMGTQIKELPKEIGNLVELETLNLNNSKIEALPNTIGNLLRLENLDLSRTQFKETPRELVFLTNLRTLNLSYSNISTLPDFFFGLKQLKTCNLSGKSIPFSRHDEIRRKMPWCNFTFSTPGHLAHFLFADKDYKAAVEALQVAVQREPQNDYNWSSLSFYSLFTKQPQIAIQAAQKSLELAPDKEEVELSLALGYLLDNQWNKAFALFEKWKGELVPGSNRDAGQVFIEEIQMLEEAGITHPDFEKVKKMFQQ